MGGALRAIETDFAKNSSKAPVFHNPTRKRGILVLVPRLRVEL